MEQNIEAYIRRSISDIARKCHVKEFTVIQKIKQTLQYENNS